MLGNGIGGGVMNSVGTLEMNDSSSVCANQAERGAGVFSSSYSPLRMSGSSHISGNTARQQGGGVWCGGRCSASGVTCAPQSYANVYDNKPEDCHFATLY